MGITFCKIFSNNQNEDDYDFNDRDIYLGTLRSGYNLRSYSLVERSQHFLCFCMNKKRKKTISIKSGIKWSRNKHDNQHETIKKRVRFREVLEEIDETYASEEVYEINTKELRTSCIDKLLCKMNTNTSEDIVQKCSNANIFPKKRTFQTFQTLQSIYEDELIDLKITSV